MRRRTHFLRRLRRRPADTWLFLRILLFTIFVPALFRIRLSLVRSLLAVPRARMQPEPRRTARIIACVRAAQRIGRPLVHPGCLTRASTLYFFLRRAGHDVNLCFGTGQPRGRFAAHCWLELGGAPFLERRDASAHFAELFRIPGAASGDPQRVVATLTSA